jgi:hypothetical protein
VGLFLWKKIMGYVICQFQNTSGHSSDKPDIVIDEIHPDWKQIVKNWKDGKNPTDSKLWKKGVVALTKLKEGG